MTTSPVLVQPDRTKPFTIETDASEWAIGCSLLQVGEDDKLHPVAYDGRKLSGAELNYPVHEKELLAIKHALGLWDRYIDNGHTTTVITDHESLIYLQTTTKPSKRLARWISEFQAYDLQIKYRKGADAIVPDAISRRPDFMGEGPANAAQGEFTLTALRGCDEAEWLEAMIARLKDGSVSADKRLAKVIEEMLPKFKLAKLEEDVVLYRDLGYAEAPYLEPQFRRDLVSRMHKEFGHLGSPGLMGVLEGRAYWPSMEEDIQAYAQECPNCQVSKGARQGLERERAQHQVEGTIKPFERWGIDLIGGIATNAKWEPLDNNSNRLRHGVANRASGARGDGGDHC
ncbi:hypothetical protein I7I48_10066 [Histoplasma ohiense]|nr:hypothetical protein I7I48_10066 [Histoplasma ohiense (nom. inval.)]